MPTTSAGAHRGPRPLAPGFGVLPGPRTAMPPSPNRKPVEAVAPRPGSGLGRPQAGGRFPASLISPRQAGLEATAMAKMKHAFPLNSLSVDRSAPVPLHRQLYQRLREMIEGGVLGAGTVLPSTPFAGAGSGRRPQYRHRRLRPACDRRLCRTRPGRRRTVVESADAAPPPRRRQPQLRRQVSARGRAMLRSPIHHGAPGHPAFHPGLPDAATFRSTPGPGF